MQLLCAGSAGATARPKQHWPESIVLLFLVSHKTQRTVQTRHNIPLEHCSAHLARVVTAICHSQFQIEDSNEGASQLWESSNYIRLPKGYMRTIT